jgi:N-ethylmaleimide reductase
VNRRDDEFGGSVEGRCRFMLALVDALAPLRGADRIGVRLHPGQTFADVYDDDPLATYTYLLPELSRRGVGYLHMSLRPVGWDLLDLVRRLFDGTVIAGGGLSRRSAIRQLADQVMDLASFGQAFIANPDLVERYRNGWTLTRPDPDTYYSQGREGYVDYPLFADTDPATQVSPDLALASRPPTSMRR